MSNPIIFYDGVCGLCNGLVQFLLKRDKHDRLRFASLQSEFAAKVLSRHGIDPKDLDTVHVVENYGEPNERVLNRSDAILQAARQLGGIWAAAARSARILPGSFRDLIYGIVARNRYRIFGKYDTCILPEPHYRGKFLDLSG